MDKPSLRRHFRELRLAVSPEARERAALRVAGFLPSLIPAQAQCVAGYAAIKGEIDCFPALAAVAAKGVLTALPILQGKEAPLAFRAWLPDDPLERAAYAIPEPEQCREFLLPEIVLVPLLAFDRTCHRLGYGGGYYDRTLAALKAQGALKRAIGIGFAAQESAALPAGPYDIQLDAVVTEEGVITP